MMSFNVLVMVHSPDADSEMHRSFIDTGKFKLWSVVVRDQAEALDVAKRLVEEKQIDSILLCPGFSHQDVAEILTAFDGQVGVSVARGDGLSNKIAAQARARAYGGG
ncbi:MAG: DUF6506 family protein [Brevefilum sp.]|nr:DUF6506 family protein [Brevefilum sp.]MDT8382406.1 DUF6506 family protein [Brevefilum sp.]MDW7754036.1 DUF6506 family protein [Brevefilum sp.]